MSSTRGKLSATDHPGSPAPRVRRRRPAVTEGDEQAGDGHGAHSPQGRVMDLDPRPVDTELEHEFLDLALTSNGAVRWSLRFTDDSVTYTTGMSGLLGLADAGEEVVRTRLRELLEPLILSTRTTAVWQDLDLEQPVQDTDGQTRFVRFHARRISSGGGTEALIGVANDVTRAHRDRQSLSDLADRYRLLVELSPDAICVHQDGIVRYGNSAALQIAGVDRSDQLVGRPVADFVEPDSLQAMYHRLSKLTSPGARTRPVEAELVRYDGATLPVELVSVRTTWEGRPAMQVIMRDITTKKAAEATLRYQAALVQHVSNAIIATDRHGLVTSWNPAAEAVYGISNDKALGRHVGEVVGAPLCPTDLLRAEGGVLEALHSLGLRTGRDVGVVAFDDAPWATLLDPPLTVVAQPAYDIGAIGAQLLLSRIGGDHDEPTTKTLSAHLVARGSTQRLP